MPKVPKVKELRDILYGMVFTRPARHCRHFGICPLPYVTVEAGGTARQIRDQGTLAICRQGNRPSCLPRGTVTVPSAKTLIENFRQFENVKYYLKL